ncbi:hypothetical protein BJ997_003695 [Cryobacterium roopkundense]|nr:hypothetical protein [Cryobacterium roopkundense]
MRNFIVVRHKIIIPRTTDRFEKYSGLWIYYSKLILASAVRGMARGVSTGAGQKRARCSTGEGGVGAERAERGAGWGTGRRVTPCGHA